jgi:hypothetical protein
MLRDDEVNAALDSGDIRRVAEVIESGGGLAMGMAGAIVGRGGARTPTGTTEPQPLPEGEQPSRPPTEAPSEASPLAETDTEVPGDGKVQAGATGQDQKELRDWQVYEQKHGSQQTPMTIIADGQTRKVRLDVPPTPTDVLDFKDYNWSKGTYDQPFMRQKVIDQFQAQIRLYQAVRPNVVLQFSREPPDWVVKAIFEVGGSYSVKP